MKAKRETSENESSTGVAERILPRDERRDPWGGASVQDVDSLPSGSPARPTEPIEYTDVPEDSASGGRAGLVGEDDVLIDRGK